MILLTENVVSYLHFSFSWPPYKHHIFHIETFVSTILDKFWMKMSEPVAGRNVAKQLEKSKLEKAVNVFNDDI